VTIRPKFFGTVPNFEGLSQIKYEVIWDAEFSRIPNSIEFIPIYIVKICCSDQNAVDHFDVFVCQRCVLLSSKRTRYTFGPDPAGGAYKVPPDPLVGWGWRYPLPIPVPARHLRRLDLGIFTASKSVPNFYHRFMVTST